MKIQNKSNDRKYFTIIPNYIANHSSANDQALYFQMKRIVGDGEGVCYASEKYFKDKLKIGSKALKNSIQYLKEHGWIEEAGVRKVKTDGGKQDVRVYLVKDIWKMNTDFYSKGVPDREPLKSKGVSESKPRGVQKETKGVASEQQRRTTNKNSKKNISKTSFADKNSTLISEIIKLFESINPACKKMYGNITQRGACEFLLEEYGFDRVKKIIEAVLPKSNGMEFFPTITTPCKLRDKWADLEFALKKYQGTQKKQVKTIIGLEKFI